jgi:tRNA(Ile)-lysidine synthase
MMGDLAFRPRQGFADCTGGQADMTAAIETTKTEQFEAALAAAWPPAQWRDVTVLLAVSGGPDSVALLQAMSVLKRQFGGAGRLAVAHFNHRLRGDAGDDARFVQRLTVQLELPFELGEANARQFAEAHGDGIEAAARDARYAFLHQTAEKLGARYVVTGHTADDQIETVLFNFLRGTGLAGLAGISRARSLGPAVSLIRPLLGLRRMQVMKYLAAIDQPFCIDSTNTSNEFSRNRLRNEMLPMLRETYHWDVEQSMLRLSALASDAQSLIERLAAELLDSASSPGTIAAMVPATPGSGASIIVKTAALQSNNRHLIREMFITLWRRNGWPQQDMGFAEWDALAEMVLTANDGSSIQKRCLPGGIVAERSHEHLTLWQNELTPPPAPARRR